MTYASTCAGIGMSLDFPGAAHDAAAEKACMIFNARGSPATVQSGFLEGWRSVAFRFASCAEHGERFTASLKQFGTGPDALHRYAQERDFFDFIASGVACIEAFHYAVYALASVLAPVAFPFAGARDRRRVNSAQVKQRLQSEFPATGLTTSVLALHADSQYSDWTDIRNVLAHRGLPGRQVEIVPGGEIGGQYLPFEGVAGVRLDAQTTGARQAWLAQHLKTALVDGTFRFMPPS